MTEENTVVEVEEESTPEQRERAIKIVRSWFAFGDANEQAIAIREAFVAYFRVTKNFSATAFRAKIYGPK